MHWFYYVGRFLTKALLLLLTRWQVKGRENIPVQGPLLVVANHLNLADPPILGVSINRKMVFLAKEELFRDALSRFFVKNYGAFPVQRGRLNRAAFDRAGQFLAKGIAVAMFPEGKRSKTRQLESAFPGTAMLAWRCGAPILPVAISGTERIKGFSWIFSRPKITVNIGTAFRLPQVNGKVSKEELNQFTNTIMGHIAQLLPEAYRGIYGGNL